MADWQQIKTEYITTDTSYRKLAQKHGVRYATLQARAKEEKWTELRDQHRTRTVSKTLTKISNKQADKLARIESVTDKLLSKLEKAVDELDLEVIKKKVKVDDGLTETTTESMEVAEGGIVDRAGLRQLTAALKDLKEIQMLRSELDRQEQEARIDKLRKEAMVEKENNEVKVTILGELEEYSE